MSLESDFQTHVINRLRSLIEPNGYVICLDGNYIQGFPDILFIYKKTWGVLECKKSAHEKKQPNQDFYVEDLDRLSFASFIHPDIEDEVFDALQQTLRIRGPRISKR
jgi:hypothetical protein